MLWCLQVAIVAPLVLSLPSPALPAQLPRDVRSGPEALAREAVLAAPSLEIGSSVEDLIRFFGPPLGLHVERRPGLRRLADEVVEVRFGGADARISVSLESGGGHLERLAVRDRAALGRLALPFELLQADVEREVGPPDGIDGDVHRFELCGDGGCSRFRVTFDEGAVVAFEWEWWWD